MMRSIFLSLLLGSVVVAAPLPQKAPEVPKELLKARLEAAQKTFAVMMKVYREGRPGSLDELPLWSVRILEAQRALATTKAEHVTACREHLDRMKDFEKMAAELVKVGVGSPVSLQAAVYHRLDAEVRLAEAEGMK